MTTTIRAQIIDNVVSYLEVVRTAGGYNTEIGRRVERARKDMDPDELEAIVVWPNPETVVQQGGKNLCTFPLRLEGLMDFGSREAQVVAEEILGDLIRAMTNTAANPTGSLANQLKYAAGGTEEYPEPGQSLIGASAVFNIEYKTKIGDPYTQ